MCEGPTTFTFNKNNLNIKTNEHICIFSLDQLARSYHKPRILLAAKNDSNEAQDRNQFVFNQYTRGKRTTRAQCGYHSVIFTDARFKSVIGKIVSNYCWLDLDDCGNSWICDIDGVYVKWITLV